MSTERYLTLPDSVVTTITSCRICGEEEFRPVLDLGEQCIGNAFHDATGESILCAPLRLVRCGSCSLVQLAHRVSTDLMYASYWYRSGVNQTMRDHLAGLAAQAQGLVDLEPGDVVIDIGSNDGTSLACYPENVHRVGVDPSNIRPQACDTYIHDYFSRRAVSEALQGRKAKIITSIAMFYDLNDPCEFAEHVGASLRSDGVWVLELSYLPTMLRANSYDTVCHEHVCYYRIATFEKVLSGTGLELFDVEFNESNGGSFRLFVAPHGRREKSTRYLHARVDESRLLLDRDFPYRQFSNRVERAREHLERFLHDAGRAGKLVYGYGASTKGMVTLQHSGVTRELMPAIAERNPDKYGLYTPGTNIPICSESEMREARPDYLVVLPWHFLDEFVAREADYLAAGGKFVLPLPEFRILDPREA